MKIKILYILVAVLLASSVQAETISLPVILVDSTSGATTGSINTQGDYVSGVGGVVTLDGTGNTSVSFTTDQPDPNYGVMLQPTGTVTDAVSVGQRYVGSFEVLHTAGVLNVVFWKVFRLSNATPIADDSNTKGLTP